MRTPVQTSEYAAADGLKSLPKTPSGIVGLDEVTGGGLPKGRPTLVCGPAGCGKTLMSIEFLVRGSTQYGESGVFLAFEETREDLIANVTSLGFDLQALEDAGQLVIDHVNIDPVEIDVAGDWDLDGLFIRLGAAIDAVGAKRVVIDTIENLFGAFTDTSTLRAELRRLFRWLKERGVTAIITGERGDGTLTRYGIEEYVSDCVIVLDHRVSQETSTRRLRILKYRGSLHGTNEYPFLISKRGVVVVPITSLGLEYDASGERLSIGVPALDEMLDSEGVLRGSSILVSGTAGTGKSTIAARFCETACARGERTLYFAFEESQAQIIRNMRSVGIDLGRWVDAGLLQFKCLRPSLLGLEAHLTSMQDAVDDFDPSIVVLDPISDLLTAGASRDVSAMLARQADFLKVRGVTALFTSFDREVELDQAKHQLVALIDVWLLVTTEVSNGERSRYLSVLKARGIPNSSQIREFRLTDDGIQLGGPHQIGDTLSSSDETTYRAPWHIALTSDRVGHDLDAYDPDRPRGSDGSGIGASVGVAGGAR